MTVINRKRIKNGFTGLDIVFTISFLAILVYVFSIYIGIYTSIKQRDYSIENNIYDIIQEEKDYIKSCKKIEELEYENDKTYLCESHVNEINNEVQIEIHFLRSVIDKHYGLIKTEMTMSSNKKNRKLNVYEFIGD